MLNDFSGNRPEGIIARLIMPPSSWFSHGKQCTCHHCCASHQDLRLKEQIPQLREHIPEDTAMVEYQRYLTSGSASRARCILIGLLVPHYSWTICGLVILCPYLAYPASLDLEDRDDDLMTLIGDLYTTSITPRGYAVMCRLLTLGHLDLPENIQATLRSQVSAIQCQPAKYSFGHLRFVAAHLIASRIGDHHENAKSAWRALEAMVYHDLEVNESCTVLVKAYEFTLLPTPRTAGSLPPGSQPGNPFWSRTSFRSILTHDPLTSKKDPVD